MNKSFFGGGCVFNNFFKRSAQSNFISMLSSSDEFLTVDETAKVCRLSTKTIRRWIKTGQLPAVKLGRQYRIRRHDLENMFQRRWQK